MDRLSLLSDDLLLKILCFIPIQDAVNTSLLSKRWCSLWKFLPNLTYTEPYRQSEYWRASRFVDKFLLLHKAPVLDSLYLTLGRNCPDTDIETWIRIAVSRGVRYLKFLRFGYHTGPVTMRLPRVLFTCETLVSLFLQQGVVVDDVPLTICLRSLKVLVLLLVKFSSNEVVGRLLSGCPVLVDLKVARDSNDNFETFTIDVPSLRRLTINDFYPGSHALGDDAGFVIKAPSLNSLEIVNQLTWCYSFLKMPCLVKADIKLRHADSKMFKDWFISAKHVSLCLQSPPMDSLPIGIFNQLVSLNLCTCSLDWCRLMLRHTPKLRVLRFERKQIRLGQNHHIVHRCGCIAVGVQARWELPSSVPECLISSLETVEFTDYKGTEAERKIVMYLLENSRQLKKMAISSLKSTTDREKLKMLQEISSTHRSSSKCRLSFT